MGIQGTNMKDSNARLRFLGLILLGVLAFGAIMYWRHETLVSAEYVEFDIPKRNVERTGTFSSKNYQIEVQDTSPTAN